MQTIDISGIIYLYVNVTRSAPHPEYSLEQAELIGHARALLDLIGAKGRQTYKEPRTATKRERVQFLHAALLSGVPETFSDHRTKWTTLSTHKEVELRPSSDRRQMIRITSIDNLGLDTGEATQQLFMSHQTMHQQFSLEGAVTTTFEDDWTVDLLAPMADAEQVARLREVIDQQGQVGSWLSS